MTNQSNLVNSATKLITRQNFYQTTQAIMAAFNATSSSIPASKLRAELANRLGANVNQISGYLNKAHQEYNELTYDSKQHTYALATNHTDYIKAAYNAELKALNQLINQHAVEMTPEQFSSLKTEQGRLKKLLAELNNNNN